MMIGRWTLVSGLLAVCALGVHGIVDYCVQNTYPTNSTWLQLNKEASSYEYAVENQFKGLHCCAKGYRSIEWFKDGRAYPWPAGTSNMILYPESANQTVYTQGVAGTDAGNYTCVLRNDTHLRSHTIHLHVFNKIPDDPKITYRPKSPRFAQLGQSVRLFCEAFVGRVDLPDALNDASWRRAGHNGSLEDEPRMHQEKVPREDGLTLGAYLVIQGVTKEDYGDYICRISKPDTFIELPVTLTEKLVVEKIEPILIPWKNITWIFVIILLFVLTLTVLNLRYGLALRVWFKDHFGPVEDGDGKLTDVLICYSQKDAEIVLGVLVPKLETKYHYNCGSRELSSNVNNWPLELSECSWKSRRLLPVLSPALFSNAWDPPTLHAAFVQLRTLSPGLRCCLALKPLPHSRLEPKNARGETLASVCRGVRVLEWSRANGDALWLGLRLHLPAKRTPTQASQPTATSLGNHSATRLTTDSRESLEILV